jgi:transcriptional regulator with XRE-family HTH domain
MNDSEYLKRLGSKIRTERKARKMSHQTLSELCKVDKSHLWRIEVGRRNIRVLTLRLIADAFKMDVKDFL